MDEEDELSELREAVGTLRAKLKEERDERRKYELLHQQSGMQQQEYHRAMEELDSLREEKQQLEMKVMEENHRRYYVIEAVRDCVNKLCAQARLKALRNRGTPMTSLGPLMLQEASLEIHITPSHNAYETGTCDVRLSSNDFGSERSGRVSPLTKVTLAGARRAAARIPENAETFAWMYPLPSCPLPPGTPEHDLVTYGGFLYIDESYHVVSASAVAPSPGDGLCFQGPFMWSPHLTRRLWEAKRFQPVTLHHLLELGVKYFCWVLPNELLSGDGTICHNESESEDDTDDRDGIALQFTGVQQHLSGDGAFVYLFGDLQNGYPEPNDRDCYFIVDGGMSEKEKRQKRKKEMNKTSAVAATRDLKEVFAVMALLRKQLLAREEVDKRLTEVASKNEEALFEKMTVKIEEVTKAKEEVEKELEKEKKVVEELTHLHEEEVEHIKDVEDDVKREREDYEGRMRAMTEEHTREVRELRANHEDELERVRRECERAKEELRKERDTAVQRAVEDGRAEKEAVQRELEALREEVESERRQGMAKQERLLRAQSEFDELKGTLTAERDKHTGAVRELQQQLSAVKAELEGTQRDVRDARREVQALEKKREEEVGALRREVEEVKGRCLSQVAERAEAAEAQLRKARGEYTEKLRVEEGKVRGLEEQVDEKERELRSMRGHLERSERDVKEAQREVASLRDKIAEMRSALEEGKAEALRKEDSLRSLRTTVDNHEHEIRRLSARCESLAQERDRMASSLRTEQSRGEEASAKLKQSEDQRQELKAEVAKLRRDLLSSSPSPPMSPLASSSSISETKWNDLLATANARFADSLREVQEAGREAERRAKEEVQVLSRKLATTEEMCARLEAKLSTAQDLLRESSMSPPRGR